MPFRPRPTHPYAHAARLPEGDGPVLFADLIPGAGPVEIEIGPGRGGFLFERAAAAPGTRLVGLEIRMKWAHVVDQRLQKPCRAWAPTPRWRPSFFTFPTRGGKSATRSGSS